MVAKSDNACACIMHGLKLAQITLKHADDIRTLVNMQQDMHT